MVSDFKETLEVVKNSSSFLSYSFRRVQENLAFESSKLLDCKQEASLEEVSDLIDEFCETQDKANASIHYLLNNGKVTIVEEY